MMMNKYQIISTKLKQMYPNAKCELDYQNLYQLMIAVVLSAQTTDKSVNIVTKDLFSEYPDFESLASAEQPKVETIIKRIGLYKNKAKNIIELSKIIVNKSQGKIPNDKKELITLPGVGNKVASVMLVEGFNIPAFPVDTHVERVSKRLGICGKKNSVIAIQKKLEKIFIDKDWHQLHHCFIFHGRYCCKANRPACDSCLLVNECKYAHKHYQANPINLDKL